VEGVILSADGFKAADIVYDIYATAQKVKAENEGQVNHVDAWVNELQTR
jgi:hypothetical protein